MVSRNFLNEIPITEFLEQQKAIDGAVTGYSFVTGELSDIVNKATPLNMNR